MTNFYAVYLFIIIAIVLLGLGLWFKRGWLFLLGALAWLFSSFYCFTTATATTQYIYLFGVFCLIFAVAMVIGSISVNRQNKREADALAKKNAPVEISHSDHLASEVERVRKLRGKHRLKNTGLFD